jgi:glutathionyl-hydroquinone reductase
MNLYPEEDSIRSSIEEIHYEIYDALLNGVYKTGVSLLNKNIPAHESARLTVYKCLNKYEKELSTRDYLVPRTTFMTIADLRLFMCLIRYDTSYRAAFGLNKSVTMENGMVGGGCILRSETDECSAYPNLRAYMQRMYPAIESEIDWPSFRQYYRWTVGHPSNAPLPSIANLRMDARKELL